MNKTISATVGKSDGAKKAEQAADPSTSAVASQRVNIQMVQNVRLIWLDNNIDANNVDCRNTITQLRCVVNTINTFTDGDQCIQFIEGIDKDKVCMIISGFVGQHIIPRMHDLSQVDSIFVFCGNQKRHEQWAKDWTKIKGVFTEIAPICQALKQSVQKCEQNAMSISFIATSDDVSKKNLDQLDCSFMYTQILKEILLTINFEVQYIKQFIDYCREMFAKNDQELNNIKKFEEKYRDETPVWWYTYECFLYPLLNRALRRMDVDIIIRMGFFINDLHRHIDQLHSEQFGGHQSDEIFTVYRGQGLSKMDFQQLMKTNGGLISFNNFLSTSKDRNISLGFAHTALPNPDLVGILFVIMIDPSKSTTPFASITGVSYFQAEDEVLFSMHTVFRICDIKPMDKNNPLFQVDLTLTNDNDEDLHALTDRIREVTFPDIEGWYRLGILLIKMGQFDKAQQVYEVLLDQETEEIYKAPIFGQLGVIKRNQGEYTEAIKFFEKALDIYQETLSLNHPILAISYNNIGNVYNQMGENSNALSSYEKALEIQQQSLPPNHPTLAISYSNIGSIYDNMGESLKALSSYEKALEIRQQSLPSNHPDLAMSYNNIGTVYRKMREYLKALSFCEKALKIKQQSLPPNHPDLASSYTNIGNVYSNMGEYSNALSYYEKALGIQEQLLSPNHPNLASSCNNIGLAYDNMREYWKACSFYERAVNIGQCKLPSNHPELQKWRKNLEDVKKKS